ncbi:MAG: two-component regulator propeller domain-containing protein [Mangrovibacterium sp.]
MKTISVFFVFFYLLGLTEFCSAKTQNDLHFSQISAKDGLSQNTVRSILEDKKGFIWAGTLDGLNKYDGYHITTYKPEIGNPNSLIDHRIRDIYQGRNGYLWIRTYNDDFCCYDPKVDSFINYLPKSVNSNDSKAKYNNLYEDHNGNIWLWGKTNGCIKIGMQEDGTFTGIPFLRNQSTNNDNQFLFEDSDSTIWIGGNNGLYCISQDKLESFFNQKYCFTSGVEVNDQIYFATQNSVIIAYHKHSKTFQEIKIPEDFGNMSNIARLTDDKLLTISRSSGIGIYNISDNTFKKPEWAKDTRLRGEVELIVDKNDGVWLYNHSGIVWYYNQGQHRVKRMELIPADLAKVIDYERYTILIDSDGLIWITTYGNGLFTYNPESDELHNYKYNDNQNSPASDYLLSIAEDNHDNIWVGSEYAGIIKIVKSNYKVEIIKPEEETNIGKNNNVRSLFSSNHDQNIWVGTKTGNLYIYKNHFSSKECIYTDINPYALAEDGNGKVWIGTKGHGLFISNKENYDKEAHFSNTSDDNSLSCNTIFSILKDSKNRMWIGTFGGGINLAEKGANGTTFRHFFSNEGSRSYIRYLLQDSKGTIWAATSDGLIRFQPDELLNNNNAFHIYRMNLNDINSIGCNDIKTIFEDRDNTIWIGTAGGGLSKYVPETAETKEHFITYTSKNGLVGDFISGILEDNNKNLWISTENGISKFNKKDSSFITYKFSEKTYGNHFNENANVFCSDGNMLWGSLDGLLIFNPQLFVPTPNVLPVTLTDFSIQGQSVKAKREGSPLKKSISYTNKIKLNYSQNNFSIEFASLGLKDPTKNKYVYILENYDKEWSRASHLNMADYKNLPHGNYIFKVRGTNSDGVWNKDCTTLQVIITPPYWLSWYAYIIYFILVVIILYICLYLAHKFNVLNNNIKVEKQLTEHKLRFFTNISHEFRTPLTIIRGAVENLNDLEGTSDEVRKQINVLGRNSSALSRLIDQLLEFRKLESNTLSLDLEEIDMVSFCKDIYSSFLELANQRSVEYTFTCDLENYNMFIDQNKVDKIIYNILSNAFKFTPKGGCIEFILQFDDQNTSCQISIKDNGVGIPKEKQHLLFSRFMQINFSSSGTGVGLSLVKDFVEVHQGKVWYESNQQQGSIFNIKLPINVEIYKNANFISAAKEDIVLDDVSSKVIHPSFKVNNEELAVTASSESLETQVLIIDDNEDIRNFLNDEFSKYFCTILAEDGKMGLNKAIEYNPYLIICDVMMPGMDGFKVTKQLKQNFSTCHIPIILLTAHSSIEHQLEGIQCGADAYIMKPFSLKYLVARVFKLIEQREKLKKKYSNDFVLDAESITSTEKDKNFINSINKILDDNISDSQFSIDKFAEAAKLKRTIFYKKVKSITGLSPNDLIKQKRMKVASELLINSTATISEIAYQVGFEDPFYFSKCFKVQYNCSPSKFRKHRE